MKPKFKTEEVKDPAGWTEAYVSWDDKQTWYAIGGGLTPMDATKIIVWYTENAEKNSRGDRGSQG